MRSLLFLSAVLCASACRDPFTLQDADHAYATMDHGSVGLAVALRDARAGIANPNGLVFEPLETDCGATDCQSVSGTVIGDPELDWEGSLTVDGRVDHHQTGDIHTYNYYVSVQGTFTYGGHSVSSNGTPLSVVIVEGDQANEDLPAGTTDGLAVAIQGCGTAIDDFDAVDMIYWTKFSLAALTQWSSISLQERTSDLLQRDERANGYRIEDVVGGLDFSDWDIAICL